MGYSQTQRNIRRRSRPAYEVDPRNPSAAAICDFCGLIVNHKHLVRDVQYRGGSAPVWTGFLVCPKCSDVPQPYFRRQVLGPDPIPVLNPRPDDGPNGNGTDTFPPFASGSLPNALTYPAGYQIEVTGGSDPGRAYADNNHWRNVETGAVVT